MSFSIDVRYPTVNKGFKLLAVAAEAILIGWFISAVVEKGWPTGGLVLWLAIIFEVGLAYLAYRLFLSQLKAYAEYTDPIKRKVFITRGLWGFVILLVGVGGPIAIYYSGIEILRPAGTPFYFLLTANSLYLYAAFRKFPTKAPDESSGARVPNVYPPNLFNVLSRGDELKAERLALLYSRIWHCLVLASIPIAIVALTVILPSNGVIPPLHNIGVSIVLAFVLYSGSGLVMLLYRWKGARKRLFEWSTMFYYNAPYIRTSAGHLWRTMCLELVVFYGFIAGLSGGIWFAIPLFLFSGLLLVLNYPTATKWGIWLSEESADDSKK
jgi:hypothetical protein